VIATSDLRTHLTHTPGPRLFLALWGGLAVVDVARAGQAPLSVQVALLVGLAAACSVGQRVGTAVAVAGVVWLVTVGFVVNTDGQLTLTGPADGLRLAVLSLAALIASAVPW
jgi:hypothetical protein